jgi:hypothetical protein
MLIMAFLVLSIGFLKNIIELLVNVLNLINEYVGFFVLRLNMGRFFLCGFKRWCNINGTQGLESEPHLKWDMAGGAMERLFVVVLNIGKNLIQCMWMLIFVHAQNVHNHLIDDLYLAIGFGVESNGFNDFGVQQQDHRLKKNVLRNLFYLLEMMVYCYTLFSSPL